MKIGILGAGNISRKVAPALVALPEIECYAVASRDLEKARAFADEFGFEKVYGSYEALLSDPAVELVYVATPHSHHYEHMMLCLQYGKHVICEKAFTMNARQAVQVCAAAREKGLFVAEAIWTRYMPSRKMIQQILDSGVIGKPNTLTANLSYVISDKQRIYDPALAGGALLDIGVYGLNFDNIAIISIIRTTCALCGAVKGTSKIFSSIEVAAFSISCRITIAHRNCSSYFARAG